VQTNKIPTSPRNKNEIISGVLAAENDVPIVFFGKIEDQYGNAVANAVVKFGVRIYNGFESTVKNRETKSTENGLFTISGYKGQELGIGVEKTGYTFVSMNGSGVYSRLYPEEQRAHPDPNNPVLIKMWKFKGEEPLLQINKEIRLPFTNTPILFDLLSGTASKDNGDLEIVITRVLGSVSKRNPGDWSIELKPINGGIIVSDEQISRVTYEAPQDGYKGNFLLRMEATNRSWCDSVHKVFFLKSRNGRIYSKFSLDFGINFEPTSLMWFQFKGVANTNNSRNWEATAPR
jgi:hypothetical protein